MNNLKFKTIIQIALIAVLGFVVYCNSLHGDFVYDDLILVKDNSNLKTFYHIPDILTKEIAAQTSAEIHFYRPLQMISYLFDYNLWKLNVVGYHLTNILLHILVAITIYWLIYILFSNLLISFFTGMLFIAHPVHTEAVAYISGRADLLSALFILLGIVFYIKQVSNKSMKFYLLMCFSYALALFSKEYGLVMPVLLLIYSYIFKKRLLPREFLTLLGMTCVYSILRMAVSSPALVPEALTTTLIQRLPGFFVSITEYLRILLLPFNLHMEYGTRTFSFYDLKVLIGAVILFASLTFAFIRKETLNLISFSILWFLVAILPMSNLYPINAYMAEHWLYVPSIGFFLIFAGCLALLLKKSKYIRLVSLSFMGVILFLYSYLTIRQNNYWKDPIIFYKTTLKYAPNNERMYTNMGFVYFGMGKTKEAFEAFQKLKEINPNNVGSYNGLGSIYGATGENEKAILMFNKSIRLQPKYIYTYYNLAKIYLGIEKIQEAIALYKKVIEIDPKAAEAYYNLGRIYKTGGGEKDALLMFKKAIAADPGYLPAYITLGQLYRLLDREEEAMSLYKKAIANNLDFFEAYYSIGNAYLDINKESDALPLYKRAIEINPKAVEAYVNLGRSYCALGNDREAIIWLKKALELNPDLAVAHNNIALAYFYARQYDLAIKHCDKAIALGYDVSPKFLEELKSFRR